MTVSGDVVVQTGYKKAWRRGSLGRDKANHKRLDEIPLGTKVGGTPNGTHVAYREVRGGRQVSIQPSASKTPQPGVSRQSS